MNKKLWIIAGIVLIGAIAAGYFLLPNRGDKNRAMIVEVTNEVDAHSQPDGEWETAVPDMLIFSGGQVSTKADASAKLALPEGTVTLSAETVFTVKESVTRDGVLATTLTLQQGRLWVNTTTDQPHEFRVESGSAVATVRDTRFSVRIDGGETLLSVAAGEARLTSQEESVTVAAGEQALAEPEKPPSPPMPMSDAERSLWATEGEMPEMAPPTPIPTPTPTPTLIKGTFADAVVDFDQGSPGWVDFADPSTALGAPDMDLEPPFSGFVNLGTGGHLTVAFADNVIVDEAGADIRIHGDPSSDEFILVEVSADGETYRSFGEVPEVADLDLSDVELSQVSFVRIVDDGSTEQTGESAGAEIDAVEGLHVVVAGRETAVISSVDVYCGLSGPAGELAARAPDTAFDVIVQTDDNVQVFVQTPAGEQLSIPQFGDLFGSERRFHLRVPGLPQAEGTYLFTAHNAAGAPIPGAAAADVYLGGNEPHPPTNVRAELVDAGVLIRWDPSPVIPGAFDPGSTSPVGFYQMNLSAEEGGSVYGWNYFDTLPETEHLIPYQPEDFTDGDRGQALRTLDDGTYTLSMDAFSTAPEGSNGHANECSAHDPAEAIEIIIEAGEIRLESGN